MEGEAVLGLPLDGSSLERLPPNATKEQQTTVINNILDRLNDLLKTQVFSDGSSKRMLFGYQKDGWGPGKDFGIKISKEGVDVTKAAEADLLFFMDMERWIWSNKDIPFTLLGLAPDESRSGLWISDDGVDVRTKI